MKYRTDDTPANICGGSVLEIGGRDHVFVRGAGVDSVLHTSRIEVIAHAGASGMIVELERPLERILAFCGVLEVAGFGVLLSVLFNGVGLLGVF